ncbi:MAG: hypothetical protein KGP14_08115 [Betaproteobacteria bacterium]|nr:hypothetical protein [Betaproteobacteria bacterium]
MSDKPEGYVFGRPTKYRPEMCQEVMEWGKRGKSRAWMCAHLADGITPQTMATWEATHPDFLEAMTRARMLSQAHWEDLGHDNIKEREFNSSVWSRSMGARFPDDWREKVGHVGGNKDDEPIRQEVAISADDFSRRIAGLVTRGSESGGDKKPE